jgi:hypothetical protein
VERDECVQWRLFLSNASRNIFRDKKTSVIEIDLSPPNQSLKLTEPAVDDFAARCWTDLRASDWNVRATNYFAAAVRRRSLAPVR